MELPIRGLTRIAHSTCTPFPAPWLSLLHQRSSSLFPPTRPALGRKPLKSGCAVAEANLSFAKGGQPRAADPSSDPREAFPGTSQATGGSLQALIGGVPLEQDSAFPEKWCCKNGVGTWGELFQAKFGDEDEVMKTT